MTDDDVLTTHIRAIVREEMSATIYPMIAIMDRMREKAGPRMTDQEYYDLMEQNRKRCNALIQEKLDALSPRTPRPVAARKARPARHKRKHRRSRST